MGLKDVGQGLKARLKTIRTINRVFAPDEIPDGIPELPCALIYIGNIEYDKTFDGKMDIIFRIVVLIANQDKPSALNIVVPWADESGKDSVRAAIYADDTLDGSVDDLRMVSCLGQGTQIHGGVPYLSTEFEVFVYG